MFKKIFIYVSIIIITILAMINCSRKTIPTYEYTEVSEYFFYEMDPRNISPYIKKPLERLSETELKKYQQGPGLYFHITFDDKGRIIQMISMSGRDWIKKEIFVYSSNKLIDVKTIKNEDYFNRKRREDSLKRQGAIDSLKNDAKKLEGDDKKELEKIIQDLEEDEKSKK